MSTSPVNSTIGPRPAAFPAAIADAAASPANQEAERHPAPHRAYPGGRGGAVAGRALLALLRRG